MNQKLPNASAVDYVTDAYDIYMWRSSWKNSNLHFVYPIENFRRLSSAKINCVPKLRSVNARKCVKLIWFARPRYYWDIEYQDGRSVVLRVTEDANKAEMEQNYE